MESGSVLLLAICIIAVVVGIGFLIYNLVNNKRNAIVTQASKKIRKIQSLNKNYQFYEIPPEIRLVLQCNSKREFDRSRPEDFLTQRITEDRRYYYDLITQTHKNSVDYAQYDSGFTAIMQNESPEETACYTKYSFFRDVEKKLCYGLKLKPVINLCISITTTYTSPQGRNTYRSVAKLGLESVIRCYNDAGNAILYKQSAKYQRSLMTDSLRYDIMKRDGFRCVLCGATAQDGVTLHVDHIIPVSKGGKTEPGNLRTLCSNCNLGKSAKYDPYGPN